MNNSECLLQSRLYTSSYGQRLDVKRLELATVLSVDENVAVGERVSRGTQGKRTKMNVPVASLRVVHVDDSRVGVLHVPLLDPRVNLLLRGELEHVVDLSGGSNARSTEGDVLHDELEGADGGKGLLRGTDENDLAAGPEEGDVAIEGLLKEVQTRSAKTESGSGERLISDRRRIVRTMFSSLVVAMIKSREPA
jgi:hypothetical protein